MEHIFVKCEIWKRITCFSNREMEYAPEDARWAVFDIIKLWQRRRSHMNIDDILRAKKTKTLKVHGTTQRFRDPDQAWFWSIWKRVSIASTEIMAHLNEQDLYLWEEKRRPSRRP